MIGSRPSRSARLRTASRSESFTVMDFLSVRFISHNFSDSLTSFGRLQLLPEPGCTAPSTIRATRLSCRCDRRKRASLATSVALYFVLEELGKRIHVRRLDPSGEGVCQRPDDDGDQLVHLVPEDRVRQVEVLPFEV